MNLIIFFVYVYLSLSLDVKVSLYVTVRDYQIEIQHPNSLVGSSAKNSRQQINPAILTARSGRAGGREGGTGLLCEIWK